MSRIVCLAGELAQAFGTQRCGLGLTFLEMGQTTKLGEAFVDQVGELSSGTLVKVKLTSSPSMVRIENGDYDLQSRHTMVLGKVYGDPISS